MNRRPLLATVAAVDAGRHGLLNHARGDSSGRSGGGTAGRPRAGDAAAAVVAQGQFAGY